MPSSLDLGFFLGGKNLLPRGFGLPARGILCFWWCFQPTHPRPPSGSSAARLMGSIKFLWDGSAWSILFRLNVHPWTLCSGGFASLSSTSLFKTFRPCQHTFFCSCFSTGFSLRPASSRIVCWLRALSQTARFPLLLAWTRGSVCRLVSACCPGKYRVRCF